MMATPMPSPIGHALGGLAVAWSAERVPRRDTGPDPRPPRRASIAVAVTAAVLAALPDADLIFHGTHRTATHSLFAVAVVTILAIVVTGWVKGRVDWWVVLVCAGAYASHLLLDWLGEDPFPPYGIQLLWPFSHRSFISSVSLFRNTMRDPILDWTNIVTNVKAVTQEVAILGPIVYLLWRARAARRTYRNRGRTSVRADLRQPFDGEGDTA
jgi:membrane-bound metal-dependent hydrolase YbcI (DUF457 family)